MDKCERCQGFGSTQHHLIAEELFVDVCFDCYGEWLDFKGKHLTFQTLSKTCRRLNVLEAASNYAPRSEVMFDRICKEMDELWLAKETLELAAYKIARAWFQGPGESKERCRRGTC